MKAKFKTLKKSVLHGTEIFGMSYTAPIIIMQTKHDFSAFLVSEETYIELSKMVLNCELKQWDVLDHVRYWSNYDIWEFKCFKFKAFKIKKGNNRIFDDLKNLQWCGFHKPYVQEHMYKKTYLHNSNIICTFAYIIKQSK